MTKNFYCDESLKADDNGKTDELLSYAFGFADHVCIDGKEFSFDVSFGDMTIKHKCTLKEDDTINMKVEGAPMGDSEMILTRQP